MAWIIQDNYIFNDEFIPTNSAAENFLKDDAPLSCWRVDNTHDVAYNPIMGMELNPNASNEIFKGDSPDIMWRIDKTYETNNGNPYQKLMIGMPSQDILPPFYPVEYSPMIHVYDCKDKDYTGNGYAILEPLSCQVKMELNGRYDISMQIPVDEELKHTYVRKQAQLKIPIPYHGEVKSQIFRINDVRRTMDNNGRYRVNCTALHKFYDLNWFMIESITLHSEARYAIGALMTRGWYGQNQEDPGFTYSSDIRRTVQGTFKNQYVVDALVGADDSFVNQTGGKLYRDNTRFSINGTMEGAVDIGVIQYGYNLTQIDFEEDDSERITVLIAEDNFGHRQTYIESITNKPDIPHHKWGYAYFNYDNDYGRLTVDAKAYFDAQKQTKINVKVKFANLPQTDEYKDFLGLDNYEVGDKVTIYHKDLNIYYTDLEIISKTIDIVKQQTVEIEIGSFRDSTVRKPDYSNTITSGHSVIDKTGAVLSDEIFDSNTRVMTEDIASMQLFSISDIEQRTIATLEGA